MTRKTVSKADFKHFLDNYPSVLKSELVTIGCPEQWLFSPAGEMHNYVCGYTIEPESVYWIKENENI